jgi:hypothetical protein
MNLWKVMNWLAWGISALLILHMALDFFKTERQMRSKR